MLDGFYGQSYNLNVFFAAIVTTPAATGVIRCGFSGNHAVVVNHIHTGSSGEQDYRNKNRQEFFHCKKINDYDLRDFRDRELKYRQVQVQHLL